MDNPINVNKKGKVFFIIYAIQSYKICLREYIKKSLSIAGEGFG
jgi:hypothetical protein